ncbi:MAG TPA: phenylalanine--tRNA ligase subunit beta, partial [Dehalococcoidia bacterium]|nr:phenylalanine--tRNA ligase subunit beta [Dehalococcoidia bacterium]
MRVPLRWLADYVELTLPTEELARRLTVAGVEVGEIISSGGDWDGIRVAEVMKVEPHPHADRLTLVTVRLGDDDCRRVVCGAPNVAVGQRVPFAPEGTRLIDGHTGKPTVLKKATIRGVESAGMILSERELGISDSHEGIVVLPPATPVGGPLSSVLGDVVFELDLTPNRPDLLSVLGVAREVAALSGGKVRDPSIEYDEAGEPIKGRAQVQIQDSDLCPRYVAALIESVKIRESPRWMQDRLQAAGMRPINNVVDITNYVMLEMGQPLHAFDFDKLAEGRIIVRRARVGESLTLIDGSDRGLSSEMLVIADAKEAIAVAGVMGGAGSEVTAKTKNILLESANFNGPNIRRTRQALKAETDASRRFEKGLSSHLPPIAAQRAVKLMVELCGGRAARGLADVAPGKARDTRITLTQERLQRVIGTDLPATQVRKVLEALGFGCRWVPPDRFIVRVPYWRTDVSIPDDVVEEVARIVGYDELPTSQLRGELPATQRQPLRELSARARSILAASGLQEIITYSLTDLPTLKKVLPPEELATLPPLRVANPMSRDFQYARTTLRGSLLKTLAGNTGSVGSALIALFEVSRIYQPRGDDLPEEVETICGVLSGQKPDRWGQPSGEAAGFYDAKAHLDHLLTELRLPAEYGEAVDHAYLPGRTAEVSIGGRRLGTVGQVHPRVAASFEIKQDVAMFELDLEALLPHVPEAAHYRPVSPYPSVDEDLAIIVDDNVPAGQVIRLIKASKLVCSVSIFDVYTGPQVGKGKKSLAFSLSFQSPERTLSDAEVARERARIVERLKRELGAELRG